MLTAEARPDANRAGAWFTAIGIERALLLFAAAYLIAGYATLSTGHNWGDDWAQYLAHARNLAEGLPYASTGYVFNPEAPHVGPPAYSPGFPLLLAPVVRVFGLNLIALKSVSLVCLAVAIWLTFILYRDALGVRIAAAAAVFFALHHFTWALRDSIVSEPAYIVWTLAALYCASRTVHRRGIATGLACGVFALAAFSTRAVGASLIAAIVLCEILQRRAFSLRFLAIVGVPAVGWLLQKRFLALANYSAELHVPQWHELTSNAAGYWRAVADLFPVGGKLSLISPAVVIALVALGIAQRLRIRYHRGESGSGLIGWLRSVPADVWYLGISCCALMVLPFEPNGRYLLPLLPLLCAYMAFAVGCALRSARYAAPATALIVAACLGYYGALHWMNDRQPANTDALCSDCRAMYAYLRDRTPATALIAFGKPRVLAFLTERHCWTWAPARDSAYVWQEMQRAGVNYVVLVPRDHPLAAKYPPDLAWDAWRSNPHLQLVFENPTFRVLRLTTEPTT